jgi:hypothetical protein
LRIGKVFFGFGAGRGNVEEHVVFDKGLAGRVFALGPALAPSGKLTQNGQKAGIVGAVFYPYPRFFGVDNVGFGIGEDFHFFINPAEASVFLQMFLHVFINVDQMSDIGKGVFKLGGV